MSQLRTEHRAVTRQKIVGAVVDLVADGSMSGLSVPLVSRKSGVSVATIYRYFPTKDHLLDAAAEEPTRRAALSLPSAAVSDGPAYLRQLWADLATNLPLLRRQVASEAGEEMRQRRYAASKAWHTAAAEAAGINVGTAKGERLVRLSLLLTSSLALLDLHDRQGRTPDEAVDDVTWAVDALISATKVEQRDRTARRGRRQR